MALTHFRSSGNLLADRRYDYAQGAFEEGDWAAAADLAGQALELASDFAAAHALLGRSLVRLGREAEAVATLRRALELEPADELGVRIDLANLGALPAEGAMTDSYVRALFDGYAGSFDRHLVVKLRYRGPELIAEALFRACTMRRRLFHFDRMIDLGCGTGLMARALEGRFDAVEGVDLSPGMLARAARTGLYAGLHEGDLAAFLAAREGDCADLVVAADVFVYMASLEAPFREARRVLKPRGFFAFTVQAHGGEGVVLGEDARYAHGEGYLRRLAAETGFAVVVADPVSTRQDRGADVPGLLWVLER
jgi:predicted TPR repeat methyltransferase